MNGELQYQWDALANLQALTLPQGDRCSGCITAPAARRHQIQPAGGERVHPRSPAPETGRSGALQQQRRCDAMGRRGWQSSAFGPTN
ncbi:hypothetical protein M8494_11620 [Serratia ureilytica]